MKDCHSSRRGSAEVITLPDREEVKIKEVENAKPDKISVSWWSKEWLDHQRYLSKRHLSETEDGIQYSDIDMEDVQDTDKDKKTR